MESFRCGAVMQAPRRRRQHFPVSFLYITLAPLGKMENCGTYWKTASWRVSVRSVRGLRAHPEPQLQGGGCPYGPITGGLGCSSRSLPIGTLK